MLVAGQHWSGGSWRLEDAGGMTRPKAVEAGGCWWQDSTGVVEVGGCWWQDSTGVVEVGGYWLEDNTAGAVEVGGC